MNLGLGHRFSTSIAGCFEANKGSKCLVKAGPKHTISSVDRIRRKSPGSYFESVGGNRDNHLPVHHSSFYAISYTRYREMRA